MAEIGFVRFATLALQVGQAALPVYRSKFSKHQCQQPQLLAILCLMRYEAWTFRDAEVRLAEHVELRTALGLRSVPDYTTVYRFLRRRDETVLEQILSAVVHRSVPPPDCQATVAVDATGLAPGAISTFFVKRVRDRGEGFTWRHWLKWTMVVDVDRQLIVAQIAHRGPTNDCALLRPLVDAAHQRVPIALVLADAEFDSERNHQHIRRSLQAQSVIPAKRGGAEWHSKGVRAHMRQEFPTHLYRRRALMESLISAVNRQLSARAPGRSLQTQCLQALLLGIAYNSYRLWFFAFIGIRRMSTEPNDLYSIPEKCAFFELKPDERRLVYHLPSRAHRLGVHASRASILSKGIIKRKWKCRRRAQFVTPSENLLPTPLTPYLAPGSILLTMRGDTRWTD
jgi:Transposase DDE domain/Transposase domain (DUF772)